MKRSTFVGAAVVALAVVILAGGLLASNMGFKLNYQLTYGQSGKNLVALPFNRAGNVNAAKDLFFDIGTTANLASVQRLLKISDTYQTYKGTATAPGPNFALNPGEGYFVNLKPAQTVNYIAVGSDAPGVGFQLDGQGAASATGKNIYAMVYHFTGTTAKDLFFDIGTTVDTASVQRLLNANDSYQTYKGTASAPGPNFLLKPGEAYFVNMKAGVSKSYVPSHY